MVLVTKVQGPVWQYSHIAPINGALGVTLLYGLYYIILWPLIGVLYAPFLCAMCYYANVFAAQTSWPVTPFVAAASIHVVSWVFQIVGHQLFEGRAPAFTSDPIQALVLAPFFVFCEVLFDLGLFKKTRKRLEVKVVKAIRLMDHPKKA
ncbi:hypothetical protein QVD99_002086 [Batrachochytrium dendrobatidis]|nr:hypothetical protein QVD99_002086 [Batrachochytrium dendrobatidis]